MDGTLRRIIDAAIAVFGRYGFRQATVGQVAEEAGLSRQALYRYFATKELLFEAVLNDLYEAGQIEADRAGDRALLQRGDLAHQLAARLLARMSLFADKLEGSAHAAELIEASGRQFRGLIDAYNRAFDNSLVSVVESASLGRGQGLTVSASRLVAMVTAVARGLKGAQPSLPSETLLTEVSDAVLFMVRGAMSRKAHELQKEKET